MRKPRYRNVGAGKGIKSRLDPDVLQLLLDQGQTQAEIAADHGCTQQFISVLVREYDLKASPSRKTKAVG
jgi:transcriptional regulator